MIIRRKPLGTDTIRKPQSLGLSLLRQGMARVQALTVRRSSEPDQTPDWGEGIPEEVYDSIYNPAAAATPANPAAPAELFESVDPIGNDGFYADSVADAISRAEQPSPSVRPATNTARRTVRRQAQPQAPAQPAQQPAPVQRQAPPPALPVATPPAEIIPAPRPASASPSGRPVRRESLSDSDNMPRDLQAMWSLHKQLGHIRERPTGEAAQREAAERAARPRRRAEIVEVMAPKKGLPLDVPDDSVPSSASPVGEPIQRKADGSSTAAAPKTESRDSFQDSAASAAASSYSPDYYESTDESGVAPVNNTFDGGDTSPEVEFADDVLDGVSNEVSDDVPVQRETAFDSSATLVDLPGFSSAPDVQRTAQSAPQAMPPSPPFATGPTSSPIPPVDNRADQADSAAVRRSPSGATREFAPSPQLTGDPLTEGDDEPSAAGANPAPDIDLLSPDSGVPETIQRSAAIQAAISRAERPSGPDESSVSAEATFDYADTDYADADTAYTDRQPPAAPSQPEIGPLASAQRTPAAPNLPQPPPATPAARPAAVQRSATPPDDSTPFSAQRTPAAPNLPQPPPATPAARPAAAQRSATPPEANTPAAPITPANTPTIDRAANRAATGTRAEQLSPAESFAPSESAAPSVQRRADRSGQPSIQPPSAPTSQRQVQRSAAPPEYGESDFDEDESADFDSSSLVSDGDHASLNNPDNIQRSAARDAAIARAEQPSSPAAPDFDDSAAFEQSDSVQRFAAPSRRNNPPSVPAAPPSTDQNGTPNPPPPASSTPQRASQPPGASTAAPSDPPQVQRSAAPDFDFGNWGNEGEAVDTDVADFSGDMPSNFDDPAAPDAVAPPAAPRSARSAIQRTPTPDSYEAEIDSEMAFDDFGDEPSSDWAAPANSGDRATAFAQAIARAEQPAEPAETPLSPPPASPSLRRSAPPPSTPEAPAPVQRAARPDTDQPDSRPAKTPARPNQPATPQRPAVQRSAAEFYDDSDDDSNDKSDDNDAGIDRAPAATGRINRAASIAAAIARAEQPDSADSRDLAERPTTNATRDAIQRMPQRAFDGFDPDDAFAYDDVAADIETIQSRPARAESRTDTDYGDPNTADPVTNAPSRADRANVAVQRSAAADFAVNDGDYDDDADSGTAGDYGDVADDYAPADNQPASPITRSAARAQAVARAEQPGSVDQSSAFDQPRPQSKGQRSVQRAPDFSGDSAPLNTDYTAYSAPDNGDQADSGDSGDEDYSGEPAAYSADTDAFAYDNAPYNDRSADDSFEPGSPAQSAPPSLPALPSARAVQRYAASEADVSSDAEAPAEPTSGSARRPALNWPKLRRKAQAGPAVPPPEQPTVQRSPDTDQGDAVDGPASQSVEESFESDATPEEVGLLAMLGLPPTTRIGRGPSQTTEAPRPVQRTTAEDTAQRAVLDDQMPLNANAPGQFNPMTNIGNTASYSAPDDQGDADQITKNDVETIAQEVYRQLRNRLRIERERTKGNG